MNIFQGVSRASLRTNVKALIAFLDTQGLATDALDAQWCRDLLCLFF